jgi:hypothetical protein
MNRAAMLAALIASGCAERAGPEAEPDVVPLHASAATIPDGPVRGSIAGTPFEAATAYYRIHHQLGREHLDIMLPGVALPEPCSAIVGEPSVWIRFPAAREPEPGEQRRAAGDRASFSVHYQVKKDGRWIGHANAAALFVVDTVKRGSLLEGDLSACFADPAKSCIAGHFRAERCSDPVAPDVRDLLPEQH